MDFVNTSEYVPFAANLSPLELLGGIIVVTIWFLLYEELNK